MDVRYHPAIGALCLGGAVFVLLIGVLLGELMFLGVGALNAYGGYRLLVAPLFTVRPDRVEIKNVFGTVVRTVPITAATDLEVRGRSLFRRGTDVRVAGGAVARPADWAALSAKVAGA